MNKPITVIFWKRCYSITLIFKSAVIGIYAHENCLIEEIFPRGYTVESRADIRIKVHFAGFICQVIAEGEGLWKLHWVLCQWSEGLSPKSEYTLRFNRTFGGQSNSAEADWILSPAAHRQECQVFHHSQDTCINPEVFLLPGRWRHHKNQSFTGNLTPVDMQKCFHTRRSTSNLPVSQQTSTLPKHDWGSSFLPWWTDTSAYGIPRITSIPNPKTEAFLRSAIKWNNHSECPKRFWY